VLVAALAVCAAADAGLVGVDLQHVVHVMVCQWQCGVS
jgi:hypothetical protein